MKSEEVFRNRGIALIGPGSRRREDVCGPVLLGFVGILSIRFNKENKGEI